MADVDVFAESGGSDLQGLEVFCLPLIMGRMTFQHGLRKRQPDNFTLLTNNKQHNNNTILTGLIVTQASSNSFRNAFTIVNIIKTMTSQPNPHFLAL
jgi:hypothetical protein